MKMNTIRSAMASIVAYPERFFLITAATVGILFVLLIPPFNNPDEPIHFLRSYQVSTLGLVGQKTALGVGGVLPSSLQEIIGAGLYRNGKPVYTHPSNKYSLTQLKRTFTYPLNASKKAPQNFTTVAYAPIDYAPQAIAIGIGRVLGIPPVGLMYAARLAGLATYITLFFFAIKTIPKRKWTLALVALLPMSIAGAAAVTVDGLLLSCLALFVAFIYRARKDPTWRLSRKFAVVMLVLAVYIGLSKQIFFVATPLLLLLPATAFKSKALRNRYVWSVLGVTAASIVIWQFINLRFAGSIVAAGNGANAGLQISLLLHHPLHVIKLMFNTFLGPQSDGLYLMFGGIFGWIDTRIPLWSCMLVFSVLGYALLHNYESKKDVTDRRLSISLLTVVFLLFAATCAALYIYWSPPASAIIVGLQGRYFIPMVLLLSVLSFRMQLPVKPIVYRNVIITCIPLVLLVSVVTIVSRYY